ncbi:MAG: hypothetical protein AAGE01_24150 [Pseudomonadota bacterium]
MSIHLSENLIAPQTGHRLLQSRWHPEDYLHVEHGAIETSPAEPGWVSARWAQIPVPGTPFVRIESLWRMPACLVLTAETLSLAERPDEALESHWFVERLKGTPYVRFRSRVRHDHYLNGEHGSVEACPVEAGWWSSHWRIV